MVFVNLTEPAKSTWNGVIDYWVEWDCDTWVRDLTERQPVLCRTHGEDMRPRNELERRRIGRSVSTAPRIADDKGDREEQIGDGNLIDLTGDDEQDVVGVLRRYWGRSGESRNNPVDLTFY